MANNKEIAIGESLCEVMISMAEVSALVLESRLLFSQGIEEFCCNSGYEGKANENTQMLLEVMVNNISKLENYYNLATQYISFALEEFLLKDKEIAEQIIMKYLEG